MDTGRLRAALVAVDPDLGRLRTAARATLASAGTAGLLALLAGRLGLPPTGTLVGAVVAMLSTTLVSDESPRAQRVTSLLAPLAAASGLGLGTLASPYPALGAALFVATAFLAVLVRRFGPRGTTLGMLAFNTYFFAMFAHAGAADLPWLLFALALASAVAWVTRYHLVPDRPARQLRRAEAALRAWVGLVLARAAVAFAHGWHGRRRQRLRAALARLDEVALRVEELVKVVDPADPSGLRERVFAVELATGRVVAAARALAVSGTLDEATRQRLARALDPHHDAPRDLGVARSAPGAGEVPLAALCSSLDALRVALRELERPRPLVAPREPAPDLPPRPPAPPAGLHPATRQAVQAAVATALAGVAGHLISPSRWFWAVLAAFLVLTQATTVGEIAARAWRRSLGTFAGVPLGMLVAWALQGRRDVEVVGLFGCVFLAFWFLRASQAAMVTWLTAALALLYGLLGRYSPELLWLRLAETLAGAGIGAAVAALVLPTATGRKVADALGILLEDLADTLDAAAEGERALVRRTRRLDQELRELREAAEPLTSSAFPVARETVELVHAASTLVFSTRQLLPSLRAGTDEADEAVAEAVRGLAHNARALADDARGGRADVVSVRPRIQPVGGTEDRAFTRYVLGRLDDTLLEMARALGRPVAS